MKTENAVQSIPVTPAEGGGNNATKAEIRNELRHLTPTLSPIEAERVSDAPCVTRLELAELLRVSVRTVDRMIAAGEIPVRRVRGRAVRFLRSDVERYLQGEKLKS